MGKNSKEQNFIQSYDVLRNLIRTFYLFGCFDPDELVRLNLIGIDDYNQKKKKIKSVLNDHIEESKFEYEDGKKSKIVVSIIHDMYEDDYNYFCNTYGMKNLLPKKVIPYIAFLQLLNEENGKNSSELKIDELMVSAGKDLTDKYRKKRLEELSDMGYIDINKQKNRYIYSIRKNIFKEMDLFNDDDAAERFLDFVSIMRNKNQPYVCGNMLLETTLLFLKTNSDSKDENESESYESPFFVKDGHFEQVLDDEVLYKLIKAMSERMSISFSYCEEAYVDVYPIKVVTNIESGFRYLFAYDPAENRYDFYSLDMISNLVENENSKNCFDYEKYETEYRNRTRFSFNGVTCLNQGEEPCEVLLCVKRRRNKKKNKKFLKEIKMLFNIKDVSNGICNEIQHSPDKKNYFIRVKVNTVEELRPWLRKNMSKVKLCDNELMINEIDEWRKLYGII